MRDGDGRGWAATGLAVCGSTLIFDDTTMTQLPANSA